MLLFSLGNSADAFLILRTQDVGVGLLGIPLVYALFNFFYASASIPLGGLSDKIGREKVILLGFAAFALSYLGFGLANAAWQAWALFAFYGLYYATTEGVAKAFVADIVAPEQRGRAFGLYNAVIGLMALPTSFIAGLLWDKVSPRAPFLLGAGVAGVAALVLWGWSTFSYPKTTTL
jgi:MFS family permease